VLNKLNFIAVNKSFIMRPAFMNNINFSISNTTLFVTINYFNKDWIRRGYIIIFSIILISAQSFIMRVSVDWFMLKVFCALLFVCRAETTTL
jgi:hypothetical protein